MPDPIGPVNAPPLVFNPPGNAAGGAGGGGGVAVVGEAPGPGPGAGAAPAAPGGMWTLQTPQASAVPTPPFGEFSPGRPGSPYFVGPPRPQPNLLLGFIDANNPPSIAPVGSPIPNPPLPWEKGGLVFWWGALQPALNPAGFLLGKVLPRPSGEGTTLGPEYTAGSGIATNPFIFPAKTTGDPDRDLLLDLFEGLFLGQAVGGGTRFPGGAQLVPNQRPALRPQAGSNETPATEMPTPPRPHPQPGANELPAVELPPNPPLRQGRPLEIDQIVEQGVASEPPWIPDEDVDLGAETFPTFDLTPSGNLIEVERPLRPREPYGPFHGALPSDFDSSALPWFADPTYGQRWPFPRYPRPGQPAPPPYGGIRQPTYPPTPPPGAAQLPAQTLPAPAPSSPTLPPALPPPGAPGSPFYGPPRPPDTWFWELFEMQNMSGTNPGG